MGLYDLNNNHNETKENPILQIPNQNQTHHLVHHYRLSMTAIITSVLAMQYTDWSYGKCGLSIRSHTNDDCYFFKTLTRSEKRSNILKTSLLAIPKLNNKNLRECINGVRRDRQKPR